MGDSSPSYFLGGRRRRRRGDGNGTRSSSPSPFATAALLLPLLSSTASFKSKRIINGIEVRNKRYPYAVSLQYGGEHFCGGALIAPDCIITAGHCNGHESLGIVYNVVLGRHDLDHKWKGQSIKLREEVRHPEYDEGTVDNDFNLVFLEKEFTWSGAEYIRLNADPKIPAGAKRSNGLGDALTVVGWGDVDPDQDNAQASDVLMETRVYAMDNDVCEKAEGMVESQWGDVLTNLNDGITGNMLCARADDTDACQGDSGGPLIKKGNDPSGADDILVGIVSWGLGCADEVFPGVYARISAQYDWIRSQVCERSTNPPDRFDCFEEEVATEPATPAPVTSYPSMRPVTLAPATTAPTRSPLPDGSRRLLVVVELDNHPGQTGWTLSAMPEGEEDEEGEVVIDMPIGSYASSDAGESLAYETAVGSERFYNLKIYDLLGNGFAGRFVVFEDAVQSDEKVLVMEPGFTGVSGTSVSHGFYVGDSPDRYLTLEFVFDDYADEVAYEIKNDDDGTIFALAWFETFPADAVSKSITIPIYGPQRGDRHYTLKVWDDGNDGICCSWGEGGYQLFLGDSAEGNLLRSGGDYGSGESFSFLVEGDAPPTSSPTGGPSQRPTPNPATPSPSLHPTLLMPTENPSERPSPSPTYGPISLPLHFEPFPKTEPIIQASASDTTDPPSSDEFSNEEIFSSSSVGAEDIPSVAPSAVVVSTEAPSNAPPVVGTENEVGSLVAAASEPSGSAATSGSQSRASWSHGVFRVAIAGITTWTLLFQ